MVSAVQDEIWPNIRRLLKEGADPDARMPDGTPCMLQLLRRGLGRGSIEPFLKAGADPNLGESGQDRGAPLRAALENANPFVARALLEAGADPKALSPTGISPLHLAAGSETESLAYTRMLMEFGAEPEARGRVSGDSPLHWTVIQLNAGAARALVEEGGADVNGLDACGNTALHRSVVALQTRTARDVAQFMAALMACGADPTIRNDNGDNVMDCLTVSFRNTFGAVAAEINTANRRKNARQAPAASAEAGM